MTIINYDCLDIFPRLDSLFASSLPSSAHVAKKNEVTKKWNDVNDHFFNQNETQALKAELYKKDDQR